MTGNQREIGRREKKNRKDRRNKLILWIVIAVVIVILAVMKICEININSVKDYFTDEKGNFTLTQGVIENNFPFTLDSSQNVSVKNVNNKIAVLTPNSFSVINSKNAQCEYSFTHGYSNPLIDTAGIYTLVYDQGAKQLRLDNTNENIYTQECENNIFCGAVAKNGTIALATTSSEKKSDIVIKSKSLKTVMNYQVSFGYVVDITINDSGNKIAFVAVNSENAQLKAKLYTMSVGSNEVRAEIDLPLGNIIDIKYSTDNIYVVGDRYVGVVTNQKHYKDVFEADTINTASFTYTPANELILLYNSFNNSTDNSLVRVKSNGRIRKEISVSGNVKALSASTSVVSVLTNNEIFSYNLGNMKEREHREVDDSVKSICRMGSEVFVHRQSLIDKSEVSAK